MEGPRGFQHKKPSKFGLKTISTKKEEAIIVLYRTG
jgi:hypothetical protein